jgi:hypothetical protein
MTELIEAKECAKRLGVTYGGLAVARCKQRWKLPFVRIGRKIFYREQDIEAFITANLHPGDGPQSKLKSTNRRSTRNDHGSQRAIFSSPPHGGGVKRGA